MWALVSIQQAGARESGLSTQCQSAVLQYCISTSVGSSFSLYVLAIGRDTIVSPSEISAAPLLETRLLEDGTSGQCPLVTVQELIQKCKKNPQFERVQKVNQN